MNKKEFVALVKQYSNDNKFSSFHKEDHPAYLKLLAAGIDIMPMLLEKLQASIGHDKGDTIDNDNDPHLLIHLISRITNAECWEKFPGKYAGQLDKLRTFLIKWGKTKGYTKQAQ